MMNPSCFPFLSAKIFVLGGIFACGAVVAETYYVDFDGGKNSNSGKDMNKAWKHAPGDSNADGNAATNLDPGDKVIFKGGVVYRGSIAIPSSGTENDPIIYDGNSEGTFGVGRAIVDGGELIEGWKKCESMEEAGGSPNWANIYRTEVPADVLTFPFSLNLYEKETLAIAARSPNIEDPYAVRDLEGYYVTVLPADVGTTSLDVNLQHGAIPTNFAESGWVSIWIYGNQIAFKKVTSIADTTITYDEVKPHPNAGNYALWNHPSLLDQPGEFSVIPEGDKAVVLYWPRGEDLSNISRSVREEGIDINKASHVQIRHFVVRRFAEKEAGGHKEWGGYGIVSRRTDKGVCEGIVLEDNIVTQNLSLSRRAAISMNKCADLRVANNSVVNNSGNSGIGVFDTRNAVVEKNFLRRNGGTALRCFDIHDSRLSENTITKNTGTHANGITIYVGSSNVIVEKNNVRDNLFPCTLQASNNITIRQNIFDAGKSTTAIALYGTPKNQSEHQPSNIIVENNTLVAPTSTSAFRMDVDIPGTKFVNNITNGGPDPSKRTMEERSGNFYTSASSAVRNSGEVGAEFPSADEVFVNPEEGDYRVKPGSNAEKAGVGCTDAEIAADAKPTDPRSP